MQKLITTAIIAAAFALPVHAQVAGLVLYADSLYKSAPADQFEIDIPNYVYNFSGQAVTMKWTRTLQQPFPNGWVTNFCDNNLCYLGQTSTAQFDLEPNDTGLLKPVFYPYETPGTGIMRLKLESLTPAVPFLANIVYVAVATPLTGTSNWIELREGAALFPNPASDQLQVVFVNPDFRGTLQVTDATGRIVLTQTNAGAQEQLNISGLAAGFYSLQAWSETGQLVLSKAFSKQ